jgi:integrase
MPAPLTWPASSLMATASTAGLLLSSRSQVRILLGAQVRGLSWPRWIAQRHGGDTNTEKSRRTLALPRRCSEALREHRKIQAKDRLRAGALWQDRGLVFSSTVGTPLTANNVIRAFRAITEKAGLGKDWVPREMRHTFVSVLSANGVPLENIALLAGHDRTATTELVYRHEIRPALTQGQRQWTRSSTRPPRAPRSKYEQPEPGGTGTPHLATS